ncbi:DUF4330 domain-containing protein [Cyanobium sp. HWJ4-Hawea]|uniref:DUF4330 domain-containing protein n=1 Tax=Cyanobium sp. HWJ4-Hawea TaxID=2823713 RepID=UPI0020CD702A|nr:DUF4330 domain-containing protein [Cyanobium sp. HWJ4-Hawea]MCP9809592.1 DUF4330 domain-containing protein [Cyanobium sp. HWJ4-Hawea]
MAPESNAPIPNQKSGWGLVDLGAAAAVVLALGGVIWSPKLSGAIAKATGGLIPVTVSVDVRGVPVANPAKLMAQTREEGRVAIVIRNQPHGSVDVKQVIPLQRLLTAVQPNGTVVTAKDPNQKSLASLDARFVLEGQGRKSGGGVVFGNQNLKIGTPVEIEGTNYRVTGTVTDLQTNAR